MIRAGYGRSYDIGVFGSLFGHSVTQNLPVLSVQELNAPNNFERVFNLAQGPPAPVFPTVPANGRFPLPNGVFARALPEKQRPPTVDACNVTVQRQLTDTMSVEVGYVGNRGGNVFAGDGPAINVNQPTIDGFPHVPTDQRRPFFAGNVPNTLRASAARSAGRRASTTSATARPTATTRCRRSSPSASRAATRCRCNYTLQRRDRRTRRRLLLLRSRAERGPGGLGSHAQLHVLVVAELPIGRERRYLLERLAGDGHDHRRLAVQHEHASSRAACRSTSTYRDAGRRPRHRWPNRPNLIGDPDGPRTRDQWFNATPIGVVGQRVRAAGRGHVRRPGAQRAARARLLARGRVALQELPTSAARGGSRSASRR